MRRLPKTLLLVLIAFLAMPVPVLAEHSTCDEGAQVNRWRGHTTTDSAQKHGASALFESHSLNQCGTPGLVEINGTWMLSAVAPDNLAGKSVVAVGTG